MRTHALPLPPSKIASLTWCRECTRWTNNPWAHVGCNALTPLSDPCFKVTKRKLSDERGPRRAVQSARRAGTKIFLTLACGHVTTRPRRFFAKRLPNFVWCLECPRGAS